MATASTAQSASSRDRLLDLLVGLVWAMTPDEFAVFSKRVRPIIRRAEARNGKRA